MKLFSIEEFTAKRRGVQEKAEADLLPFVKRALQTGEWSAVLALVEKIFFDTLAEDTDKKAPEDAATGLMKDIKPLTKDATSQSDPEAVSLALSLAAINSAAIVAADLDSEPLLLEWVTMEDSKVRHSHRDTEGQTRPPGEMFDVDGVKMPYPGFPGVAVALWINCRCVLRPTTIVPAAAKALTAADSGDHSGDTSLVVVALPEAGSPVHGIGDEQKHVTLVYLGDFAGDAQAVHSAVENLAQQTPAIFEAGISGIGTLGSDSAKVWLVESAVIQRLHDALTEVPEVSTALEASADRQHPHFVPHMTIDYADDVPTEATDVAAIMFDRLAVWQGDSQTEYAIGDAMDPEETPVDDPNTEAPVAEPSDGEAVAVGLVPWHGILAPEGKRSGDGRTFLPNSLTHRPLPLPLTYQKEASSGHDGNVTVATIEGMGRDPEGMIWGWGFMRQTPEADEATGLFVDFGRFGVSVDADDVSLEFNEEDESVEFSAARVAAACIVAIPAFAEAFAMLGPIPQETLDTLSPMVEEAAPALVASLSGAEFKRGPGWITDPVATKRIHDYWTVPGQVGYEKINWGVPGDFNRCRLLVGEEIAENSPEDLIYLNQICAQWHHDAIGIWPGQEKAAGDALEFTAAAESLSLVATAGHVAPSDWFENPGLTEETPLKVTEDGRVFGHIACWKSCHLSVGAAEKICTAPPHSASNYAYFRTGEVLTDKGGVATGCLTIGGGHANGRLGLRPAAAHYDNTCTAVADVAIGEDDHGIWVAGWVRPGASPEDITALRASPISGDWRWVPGTPSEQLELVAGLAVNVPGFGIPRVKIAASNGQQVSMVAAGMVVPSSSSVTELPEVDELADKIAAAMEARVARREAMATLMQRVKEHH